MRKKTLSQRFRNFRFEFHSFLMIKLSHVFEFFEEIKLYEMAKSLKEYKDKIE